MTNDTRPTVPPIEGQYSIAMAPDLAARVIIELEAENERLRKGLDEIACTTRVSIDGVDGFESWAEFAWHLQAIAEKTLN